MGKFVKAAGGVYVVALLVVVGLLMVTALVGSAVGVH